MESLQKNTLNDIYKKISSVVPEIEWKVPIFNFDKSRDINLLIRFAYVNIVDNLSQDKETKEILSIVNEKKLFLLK